MECFPKWGGGGGGGELGSAMLFMLKEKILFLIRLRHDVAPYNCHVCNHETVPKASWVIKTTRSFWKT